MPQSTLPAPTPAASKWWGQSLTIWGTLITGLSTVLPVLGPALGLDITPELIRQLGDGVVLLVQAAGGLLGTILAVWGRIRATTPIERRPFTLRM